MSTARPRRCCDRFAPLMILFQYGHRAAELMIIGLPYCFRSSVSLSKRSRDMGGASHSSRPQRQLNSEA